MFHIVQNRIATDFLRKQWDGLLLNLNYCPFFGQYGDGELLVFKLGEAHGPDYSSRC